METLHTQTPTQNPTTFAPIQKQLLSIEDVKAMTGFSTTTIYKHVRLGAFPAPKNCGGRAVRWRLSDIENYINS